MVGTSSTLCKMLKTAQFLGMSSALATLNGALQLGQRWSGTTRSAHLWQTECPQGITRGIHGKSMAALLVKSVKQMSQDIHTATVGCAMLGTASAADGGAGKTSRAQGTGWTLCKMLTTAQFLGMSSALATLNGALQLGHRWSGTIRTAHVWQTECPQGITRGHRAPSLKFSAQMPQ